MSNLKTTVPGIISLIITGLGLFGIQVAPDLKDAIINLMLAALSILTALGLFNAKDANQDNK